MSEIANLLSIDNNNFQSEVLEAKCPVLVDFWAEWCGPCKMLAPVLEELAQTYANRENNVKIVKVNTEDCPEIAAKFGVRAIPTLLLMKDGNVEATQVGALSKSQLIAFIDSNV